MDEMMSIFVTRHSLDGALMINVSPTDKYQYALTSLSLPNALISATLHFHLFLNRASLNIDLIRS